MPTSVTTLRAPPAGRYIIDSSTSTVTFVTKHMFGVGKVRGRFAVVRGTVVVADRVEDSAADAEISASSFSTRNFLRDGQARSPLFLNAGRHPAISFRADGVQRHGDSWVVAGTMAPAVRATGPGRGRPGICVRPAAKSEDHRRWRQARGDLRRRAVGL